jgi:hypothetical protein
MAAQQLTRTGLFLRAGLSGCVDRLAGALLHCWWRWVPPRGAAAVVPTAIAQRRFPPQPSRRRSGSVRRPAQPTDPPVSAMAAPPTLPPWVARLLAHLRHGHGQPLDLPATPAATVGWSRRCTRPCTTTGTIPATSTTAARSCTYGTRPSGSCRSIPTSAPKPTGTRRRVGRLRCQPDRRGRRPTIDT